jgi:aminomethyltransferase
MGLKTSLYETHQSLGGQIVEFAGWDLPVQFTSIMEEHTAVRTAAGVFDVSHMGQVRVKGPGAESLVRKVFTNDVGPAPVGRVLYSHMLDTEGRIIDDVLFDKEAPDSYFIVPNAATTLEVVRWLEEWNEEGATIQNLSDDYFCIALQGPKSNEVLSKVCAADVASQRRMTVVDSEVAGVACRVQTTGYTGERGFELIGAAGHAPLVFLALLDAGRDLGVKPCGLGARDTLRLEKAFLLSGQDFHRDRTTVETGYEWVVKWDHEFVGKQALEAQKAAGTHDRWVGVTATGRGIPRHGYALFKGDERVGELTSGTMSPTLKVGIGMAYLPPALAAPGTELAFDLRGNRVPCRVTETPFVK